MAQELARDEAGNVWDVSVNPPRLVQAAGAPQTRGRIYTDPTQAREQERKDQAERRANEDQNLQRGQYGLSAESNRRSAASDAITNPQTLRKEYSALPEVKEYKIAAQMATAGLSSAANPQGDLALIYSFAKAMDPGSVVRDQESQMVSNTQPWFQAAVQSAKKQFGMDGAGSFTPEARARLRQEIVRALASRKPLYDAARAEMAGIAEANGLDPTQIIGKSVTDVYAPELRRYAQVNGDEGNVISGLLGGDPIERNAPTGGPLKPAGMGATEGQTPIPPEMQQAHSAYLAKNWGKIDPQDYAAFRINLDKQYGFGSNPEAYAGAVPQLNQLAASGQTPETVYVPGVQKELSGVDQFRNNMLSDQYGAGAGVASGLNAVGVGIPSLFAPDQMNALRDEYPVQTFVGDVVGGLGGVGLVGKGLRTAAGRMGEGAIARALATPLAADVGYGAAYGATQAEDPLYGAVGGALAGAAGNKIGGAIGRALPEATGMGGAIRAADESVPSSQALKDEASALYGQAEANGLIAQPPETLALNDRISAILSKEGRLSPTGRLTEVQPQVKEAYKLIEDYAGEPMTPTQIQTARSLIAEAGRSKEASERRIAKLLLNDFDEWTDATNPALASGLKDARGVASRYLQGDRLALADEMADIRTSQFSNSGAGNAVRTDFRALDRSIAKGAESFDPAVEEAIRAASRGTPLSNSLRNVGKFGFQHPLNAAAAIAGGGATAGPIGGAAGAGLASVGTIAQLLSNKMSGRAADVAQNVAYGGEQYSSVLQALLADAERRGGHAGTALTVEGARALADYGGY